MRSSLPLALLCLSPLLTPGCKDTPPAEPEAGSTSTGEPEPGTTTTGGADGSGQLPTTGEESVCIDGTWSGILRRGSAWTSFTECGTAETWWLDSAPEGCDDVYLTIQGTLCGPGEYGLQGAYSYILNGVVMEGPCTTDACEGAPTTCGETLCQLQCDLWEQDCPEGQKCIPTTSADAEAPWEGTNCVLLDMDVVGAGQPCEYNGLADPCESGWWCLPEKPGASMGSCVQLCQAEEDCGGQSCDACNGGETHQFGYCGPGAPC